MPHEYQQNCAKMQLHVSWTYNTSPGVTKGVPHKKFAFKEIQRIIFLEKRRMLYEFPKERNLRHRKYLKLLTEIPKETIKKVQIPVG